MWKEAYSMPDWTKSMQRTYEYYVVDPSTWKDVRLISNVKTSKINRDSTLETLGSATIDVTESMDECYIRIYMITIQNGVRERTPLGTFLVQTPASNFDGKNMNLSMDAYTPLLELKENPPPLGYSILKDEEATIMDRAYTIVREHVRAPVVKAEDGTKLQSNFVANTDDTWLSFVTDLILNAKYVLDLDELGRVLFAPKQDTASLQPVWEYNDGNSSILQPDVEIEHDLYGIPNAIEVIYAMGTENYKYAKIVNDDPNSPISTVNRGREILHRVTDATLAVNENINDYAERTLRELSCVEYSVSYTHGYCPVRVGDCVRLVYPSVGLNGIKAKVVKQSIKCDTECQVTEKAVYTKNLWQSRTYVVKFHSNGGVGTPADQYKKHGVTLILTEDIPTKTGYTFLGWSLSDDDTTVAYSPGHKYENNSSIILYAVWG